MDLSNPLWDHIGSVQKSPGNEASLLVHLTCASKKDYYFLSMMLNTGRMRKMLQQILLNEEIKEKHSLGDVKIEVSMSEEEVERTLQDIQKANQEETDLDADNLGIEPSCSTWAVVKRYLQCIGITGQ